MWEAKDTEVKVVVDGKIKVTELLRVGLLSQWRCPVSSHPIFILCLQHITAWFTPNYEKFKNEY